MLAEAFNVDVKERSYNAAKKLSADQIEYIQTLMGNPNNTLAIEEAYERFTSNLLEPVIARYWMDCGKVTPLTPVFSWKK